MRQSHTAWTHINSIKHCTSKTFRCTRPSTPTPVLSRGPSVHCCIKAPRHLAAEADQCLLITKGPTRRWSIRLTGSREGETLRTVIDAAILPTSLPADVSLGPINPAETHSFALRSAGSPARAAAVTRLNGHEVSGWRTESS